MRLVMIFPALLLAAACATVDTAGTMTEADVVAVVQAAHEGEIQHGQAAGSKASADEVRAFAQMMVADHTGASNRISRIGIAPAENQTSQGLRETARQTLDSLNSYAGSEFDRQYMQSQIDVHQWVLTALDNSLIPGARNPELREQLTNMRANVAMHLQRARQIRDGL